MTINIEIQSVCNAPGAGYIIPVLFTMSDNKLVIDGIGTDGQSYIIPLLDVYYSNKNNKICPFIKIKCEVEERCINISCFTELFKADDFKSVESFFKKIEELVKETVHKKNEHHM